MNSLSDLILHARPDLDLVAINKGGKGITWQRFLADVWKLSTHISDRAEKRWALCFNDSYWFTVSFISLGVVGKEIVVPSNITSNKALCVIRDHFDALLSDIKRSMDCFSIIPTSKEIKTSDTELTLQNTLITLFTSGSTSQPKSINKTMMNLASEIKVLMEFFGKYFYKKEVFATVSHQHIYGLLFRSLLPLSTGVPFASFMLEYPDQVSRNSSMNRVLISSPAMLTRLEEENVENGYSKVFSSGGPLSYRAAHQCKELFGALPIEVYGSSETGGIGWREQHSNSEAWQPFPGLRVKCCDDKRLQIRTPFLSQGGWYVTNDLVELYQDGTFSLMGRGDRIVKISEKRISLVDVENCLKNLDEVLNVVVVPLETNRRMELGALIQLSDIGFSNLHNQGKKEYTKKIKRSLREYIEPVGVPRRFRFVNEIPTNSQGKYEVQTLKGIFE